MAKQEVKFTKRRLRSSYITTIVSISLVLFLLGLLGLIGLHAKKLSDFVKENIGFSVIMKDGVKEARIIELQKYLDLADFVKSTEYITKEEAAEDLTKDLGEDFLGFLGYNPLLPSIDIRLEAEYANIDSLTIIEQQLITDPNVKEVFYQKSLVHLVNQNIKKISFVLLGFSVLLLVISIALINNTIRLSVYSKRFLIKSMQLVGATQYFIRKPFVINGIIHGLIAALIAIILLMGILYFSQKEIPEMINLQEIDLFLTLFGFVTLLGIIISWLSTYLAVRKYLRIKTDDLYF